MKRKRDPRDDRLSPDEKRQLAFSIAQGNAGLTYGPFGKGPPSICKLLKGGGERRRVSIQIPAALFDYLGSEAKRFGMTRARLVATIVETHQFKDQDRQLIMRALGRRAKSPKPTRR